MGGWRRRAGSSDLKEAPSAPESKGLACSVLTQEGSIFSVCLTLVNLSNRRDLYARGDHSP